MIHVTPVKIEKNRPINQATSTTERQCLERWQVLPRRDCITRYPVPFASDRSFFKRPGPGGEPLTKYLPISVALGHCDLLRPSAIGLRGGGCVMLARGHRFLDTLHKTQWSFTGLPLTGCPFSCPRSHYILSSFACFVLPKLNLRRISQSRSSLADTKLVSPAEPKKTSWKTIGH